METDKGSTNTSAPIHQPQRVVEWWAREWTQEERMRLADILFARFAPNRDDGEAA